MEDHGNHRPALDLTLCPRARIIKTIFVATSKPTIEYDAHLRFPPLPANSFRVFSSTS